MTNRSKVKKLPKIKKDIFEPKEKTDIIGQSVYLHAMRPIWLRTVNNVRNRIEQQNEYVYVPDLRAYANL
jgi:hypothetical protein